MHINGNTDMDYKFVLVKVTIPNLLLTFHNNTTEAHPASPQIGAWLMKQEYQKKIDVQMHIDRLCCDITI